MRIALLTTCQGTTRGGAEIFYDGLEWALRSRARSVDRIDIPVDETSFEKILDAYENVSRLDLSSYDVVLSTKAPTYNIQHPGHILYLVHTIRVFYDMFDSWSDGSDAARAQRDQIRELDFRAISRVPDDRRFAIGLEVALRLQKFLGLCAQVLHPPLVDADRFQPGQPEHFFHPGRLHPWKRLDLVLDAFQAIDEHVDLLISGTGEAEECLRKRVASNRRVRFLGDVSRAKLYDLYSRSVAVPFVPAHEDYGYVAIEAMMSAVPVITATDSGEPSRLIEHERTGLIVPPKAEDIAVAMKRLLHSPEERHNLGMEARKAVEGNTWPDVIRQLLMASQSGSRPAVVSSRASTSAVQRGSSNYRTECMSRLLVLDNQPIEPPIGGGRIRLWGLYSNLPKRIRPVYVGTYDWPGEEYRCVVHNDRLTEITVPQSAAHFAAHEILRKQDPSLSMDVTFPLLASLSTGYVERVAFEISRSDAVVISHPWVWPIVAPMKAIEGKPIFYDAHNVESVLRRPLLASRGMGKTIADLIERVERELCQRAEAIFACSEEDADTLASLYGIDRVNIHVIPNGVDTDGIRPASTIEKKIARGLLNLRPDACVAVFIGSRYKPNVEAAQWMCDWLAPALPDIEFLIIGGCSAELQGNIPSNVHALGAVDDSVRIHAYSAADIAINPVLQGSGTNIKMMDFLAAGLPTITTPIGMRGLKQSDEAFVVADRQDFPSEIVRVMTHPGLRQQLTTRSRLVAELRYDWKPIAAQLAACLQRKPIKSSHTRKAFIEPRLAVMSTWKTFCGIADYSKFLVQSFPATVPWSVYAEKRSAGEQDNGRVCANWEIGLGDLDPLRANLERDRVQLLLVQYHAAFFDEVGLSQLLRLAREQDVKTAVTFHALTSLKITSSLQDELSLVDRIFVHRQSDIDWLRVRQITDSVRRIPHGICRFERRPLLTVQRALSLQDSFVIGHFGYVRPQKGILELIDAFELVAKEKVNARLLLLCSKYPSEDSSNYLALCLDRIASSAYKDRIHANFKHLPMRTAIHLLQACNLIVYPYHFSSESSSAAVRFAMAAGRPILVSRAPIFEELRDTAIVVNRNTDTEIASTILSLAQDSTALVDCQKRVEKFAASHDWARSSAILWGHMKHTLESSLENA